MNENDQKKLFQDAVNRRLSGLQENPFLAQRIIASEKGEQPIMKKKLSVSVIMIMIFMIAALGAAYAWVQSNIANEMYGEKPVPQDILDHIQQPNEHSESSLGTLTVDEILYDWHALHTSFSVTNPTDQTLLYTVDYIWLNGQQVTLNRILAEGAGSAGLLLGGSVDGAALPTQASFYNAGDQVYLLDENGKYRGLAPLPEGSASLKVSVAVWRPINQPKLVSYKDYEGVNVTDTMNCLVTDSTGYVQLDLFRPQKYNLVTYAGQRSSEVYAEAYKALGWAELVDTIEVELPVNLNKSLAVATPKQTEYQNGDIELTISSFDLTHAGGEMEGWLRSDAFTLKDFVKHDLWLVDQDGQRVLCRSACSFDTPSENAREMHFTLKMEPITGDLPTNVYLAPALSYNPRWDESSVLYDPTLPKPDGVIGEFQFDFSRAIRIELE